MLVEAARKSPGSTDERMAIVRAVRRSWTLLLDRFLDGPTLAGRVRDADGRPVQAAATVDDQNFREGEAWTTRCRDGRFARDLTAPGRHRLVIRPVGQLPVTQTVEVGRGPQRLDLTLPCAIPPSPCPEEPADAGP